MLDLRVQSQSIRGMSVIHLWNSSTERSAPRRLKSDVRSRERPIGSVRAVAITIAIALGGCTTTPTGLGAGATAVAAAPTSGRLSTIEPSEVATGSAAIPSVEPVSSKAPAPKATAKPTPNPTPKPTPRPTPKPTAKPTGVFGNPWGYDFKPGNTISNPPDAFCEYFDCIPSFWDSTNGYVVQCEDSTFSHSGGRQGVCSHHGGYRRTLFRH